ncbi:MAG: hypothetical protein JW891_09725, partial [Candidatus Lokiarchaeota archaeon]|nr:hypothetical protein [Candidatus Lokiarchaeota archaeon]
EEDFESYAVGTFPSSFYLRYSGIGANYQVVTRNKLNTDHNASLSCFFGSQSHGSIEFYMGYDNYQSSAPNLNIMFKSGNTDIFGLKMRCDGKWTYWNGSWNPNGFGSHVSNQFYHISIRFRCSFGNSYEGLSDQYTWRVYINGMEFGEFSMSTILDVDNIILFTSGNADIFYGFWDAFGFSWDSNYNVGDNLNEGLLLSFQSKKELEWLAYSLDGVENKTIYGNSTIVMPACGIHFVQVFGNSSLGTYFASDIVYFTINANSSHQGLITRIYDFRNQYGLYIIIRLNAEGTLLIGRNQSCYPSINPIPFSGALFYYYFSVLDTNLRENDTILENITIRFFFDPNRVDNAKNLRIFHYDTAQTSWISLTTQLNESGNYIEITTNELSHFCLIEFSLSNSLQDMRFIIIVIIFLSIIGVSIPTGYIFLSKRKKKAREPLINTKSKFQHRVFPLKSNLKDPKPDSLNKYGKINNFTKVEQSKPYNNQYSKNTQLESEVGIIENELNCQVHRGPIEGIIYVCPHCKAKYCYECALILAEKNENCWVCNNPLKLKNIKTDFDSISLFQRHDGIETLLNMGEINLTALSKDFIDGVNDFDWDEEDKISFIEEMLALPPHKRMEYIEEMRKNQSIRGRGN